MIYQLTSSHVGVVVPDDQCHYKVNADDILVGFYPGEYIKHVIDLGEGRYEFLCLSTNATEDQAAQVVKLWNENFPYYVNYNYDRTRLDYFEQATNSLASLLESKNITETIAILRKIP